MKHSNEWLGHEEPTKDEKVAIDELMIDAYEALSKPAKKGQYLSLEDSERFIKTTDLNGDGMLLYEMIMDEMPELGLSFSKEDADGYPLENIGSIAIKATPKVTDREFIERLHENPMIRFLVDASVNEKEEIGRQLEDEGILSRGATERFLLRTYNKEEKKYPNTYEYQKNALSDVQPMSDEEVSELMRSVLLDEQRKRMIEK